MNKEAEIFIDDSKPLRDEDTFCFTCSPDKKCFTYCCHDLNLVLMPYDILRLKNRLGIKSGDFLNKYTTVHVGPESGFPIVLLKMDEHSLKCPFLDPEKGCTVYEDRPGACRTYPLARITRRSKDEDMDEFHYIVKESDCLGFEKGKEWTVKKWKDHEDIQPYNEMNDLFGELLQAKKESGLLQLHADQIDLFYLGCYNMDEFRNYFLEGPNLDRYMEPEETIQKISEDENELLKFGMSWVKKKLFQGSCSACGISQEQKS
jgi:Fe-S-cluster containining protein